MTVTQLFGRNKPKEFEDVHGFAVLLDAELQEIVLRKDAVFSWKVSGGAASYEITSPCEFDLSRARGTVYYVAVGVDEAFTFVSPIIGAPVNKGLLAVGHR